ncbi:sugar ABC transporter permease [Isoptericola cucumis]|uniref:ABC transporter permease subunit n=1 Tax=Isoptericola cucumis TaxID=1776856 RepID=UPI003208A250
MTAATTTATTGDRQPFGAGPGRLIDRVRGAHLSMLPALGALALVWLVLGVVDPAFLSAENLVNLTLQSAPVGVIALGVVLVLLVGQIDLSVGSLSGLAAAVVAVGTVNLGWPVAVSVLAAMAVGVVVGLGYGLLAARLGVPSFVLTLGGLLLLAGVQMRVLGPAGSINLPFESWLVRTVQQGFLPPVVAWCLVVVVVAGSATLHLADRARRVRADLQAPSLGSIAARTGVLAAVLVGTVAYLGTARGVGYSVVLFVCLVVVADVLLRRTRWGRAVRAVGSDRRAARLAGVAVDRTVISCFAACSGLAAVGGVLAAGRLAAANQGTGGTDTYLMAIAAAVIGGTSIFGGRGGAWSALVGVLVLQSIANGLTLLDLDLATQQMVTGTVLVLAIVVDTLVRRRRET